MEKFTFIVSEDEAGLPLKKIIKAKYNFSSRLMTKIKYQNLLMLNGETVPGYALASHGDTVTVSIPDEKSHFEPEDIPIDVLYEDQDLLIINKQAGVTCHPTKGHPNHTIANGLTKYMEDQNSYFKIRFINRLDMDTSGVLLIGKNGYAQAELNKQMSLGLTEKKYKAILLGELNNQDSKPIIVDLPIGRPYEDSKKRAVITDDSITSYPSKTIIEPIKVSNGLTLVEITLLTGRTHQIRVHTSHLGYPVLGDPLYGNPEKEMAWFFSLNQEKIIDFHLPKRQLLHAAFFGFNHPVTGERINVKAPLPRDMESLIESHFLP